MFEAVSASYRKFAPVFKMTQLVTFYLFRHGETAWNAEGRFQGHLDVALNDKGREQARSIGIKLRGEEIEALLASDLIRSIETAEIVARELEVATGRFSPLFKDSGVKEAYLGRAQGLTLEEIRASFGDELVHRWKSNEVSDADICYPDGETGREVVARSLDAIRRFAIAHPEFTRVAICSHGGVIRRVMHHILTLRANTETTEVPPHIPIPNGVVYRIQYDPIRDFWHALDL
jgi:broad specificity phosphatase PhoE